ncbi:hypothetical protein PHABIO_468 [Pseudomonas phage Phabio]|uniref:Uncharacterized protein n=1 Tax=Pseudomonas phage Phabio TaxID=2006668 RepID=A0A1Y0SZJ2_9CAUD|nr:hypothetical protein MZD05_gp451 [Pseudomonas phage Phabio]ARV77096.1 hypothetical protein PHABIO_468 [Pseudomonas phage Phabio]
MTTQKSQSTLEINAFGQRAGELGSEFSNAIFSKGIANITQLEKDSLLEVMEWNCLVQKAFIEWLGGDRSFETWLPFFYVTQSGFDYDKIDPTGELKAMAGKKWDEAVLKTYFDEEIKDAVSGLEIKDVNITLAMFEEGLVYVKALQVAA